GALRSGEGIRLEDDLFWRKDGTSFPVSLTAFPLREMNGTVSGAVVTFADTSERVAAREAIQHARRAAEHAAQARSAFLANMSHEIRTPLNAILGLTELLFDTPLAPEQAHSLDLVRSAGETLLTLLNDILDLSKIEAEQLRFESIPFDPGHLIESTLALLAVRAREKRLEMITDVKPGVPASVRGDPTRLRQILTNLVGNAIKFTEHGEVVVSVSRQEGPDPDRAVLHFSVRDSGIGIPADKLETIFEEFTQADSSTTRRYGGTGLGLAICRRLVRLQGGELRVESELGKGTDFSFSLAFPVEKTTAAPVVGTPAALLARILVVDDNPTNRRIVRDMLRAAGAQVDEIGEAAKVPDAVRAAFETKHPYALVILDAQMPDYDGFTLARTLREDPALADLRLMLLTSAALPGDGQRCRELGIQGYLPKPASRADLLDAVSSVIRGTDRNVVTRHSMAEARRSLRILLAEDNPVNQQVAATMLRKRGHQVDVVDNGREAVDAVAKHKYDVVLMDIQMPELDGLEATKEIRATKKGAHLPIVALTAHALTGERERLLAGGMTGYLSKPFKPHELFAVAEGWAIGDGETVAIREDDTRPALPPAADLQRLQRELTEAGAADALGAILDTFLADAPGRMQTLIAAVTAGDAVAVARAAHAFKSAAATIGATGLAALLADIEGRGKAKKAQDLGALVEQARKESDRVLEQVTAVRPTV
ncbi:MAG TPA: response regulator, partial [Gemmatimonadales bacterium]|nr:response regulator [Gemmatimonadales bacterium]